MSLQTPDYKGGIVVILIMAFLLLVFFAASWLDLEAERVKTGNTLLNEIVALVKQNNDLLKKLK
jgi:uncharacterized membrane protein